MPAISSRRCRTSGHEPNDGLLLGGGAADSVLLAPFGSHAINLAAIPVGICCGLDAREIRAGRHVARAAGGAFFMLFGLSSSTILALFVESVTASGMAPLGTVSAFRGVPGGGVVHLVLGAARESKGQDVAARGAGHWAFVSVKARTQAEIPGAAASNERV